ncbi:MAG: hypothetical protein FWG18_02840 [Alphaproteobacteria bacterium]|nr:hypothetical protein [Alphaproteobacteria bacterium]
MSWNEIRFFSDCPVWHGIMTDLGAVPVPKASADVEIKQGKAPLAPMELKAKILADIDAREKKVLDSVFGHDANSGPRGRGTQAVGGLAPAQKKIVIMLQRAGAAGLGSEELRTAFGYAHTTTTHTIETAVSNLRARFGSDFIKFENGRYIVRL